MASRQRRVQTRHRGRRQQLPSKIGPFLVGGGSILVLLLVAAFFIIQRARQLDLDPATLCQVSGPSAVHAMLLDRSDPITPLQAQRLRQVLDRSIEDAAVNERIDLYVLAGDATQALKPAVSLCRPKTEANLLYENGKHMSDRYKNRFHKPLDDALDAMTQPSESKTSPIMESVKAVCVAAFGGLPPQVPVRLTVASDMIQFSVLLNHYKQKDFDDFAMTPAYHEILANCHKASVDVLYLIRPRDVSVQNRKHQLFWEKFFDHEDATLVSMEAI